MNIRTLAMAAIMATTALTTDAQTSGAQTIGKSTMTFQSDLMTPEALWAMGRIGGISISPDGQHALYTVSYYSVEQNKSRSVIYLLNINTRESVALTQDKSEAAPTWITDSHGQLRVAYLCGGQLWSMLPDGTDRQQLTHDADGIGDFLFSPDCRRVILVKEVAQHHSIAANDDDLPLASGMVINDLMYKHWDHYVMTAPHPFVAEVTAEGIGAGKDILEGEPYESPMEPFGGAEQLAWSPDSKTVAYTCRKKVGRDYAISTDSDIYLYNVADGTTRNICKDNQRTNRMAVHTDYTRSLEEQPANLGAVAFPGYDDNPAFSPDGTRIAFRSMARDGYESDRTRLCVMDVKTGEYTLVAEDLGDGRQSGVEDFVWSPDGQHLFFTAVWHGKTNIYRTDLGGHVIQLTDDQADYGLSAITPDAKSLICKRHSMANPDEIYLLTLNGKTIVKAEKALAKGKTGNNFAALQPVTTTQLTCENQLFYDNLAWGDVQERWVKTTDGKDMLCWVITPPHFDPTKKYPTLLFCEGGPQSPVSQFWSYRWNFQIMAAQGYVIIAPNRRGLPGFGMEWLEQISGDYSGQCMQDYLSAIDDICNESYVDRDRLGCVGASFGGYSVYWLAGNHDKRFKAFIAHDGIYNTQQQYVETEELWFPNWDMGKAPWYKNADGQRQKVFETSPHLYVDRWDTPILCIHGQRDFRIEYTQAESAFTAARLRGLDAQMLLFPDENHWVLKPQNGILWQRTFFRWLDKYLKAE